MTNYDYLYNRYDETLKITWLENGGILELSPACLTDENGKIIFNGTFDQCNNYAYRHGYIY